MSLFRLSVGDTARAGDVYDGSTGNDKLVADTLADVKAKHKAAPYGVDQLQFDFGAHSNVAVPNRVYKARTALWIGDVRVYLGTITGASANVTFSLSMTPTLTSIDFTQLIYAGNSYAVSTTAYNNTHLVAPVVRPYVPAGWWIHGNVVVDAGVTITPVVMSVRALKLHTS